MDARALKRDLVDPAQVCGLLGLLSGRRGRDWNRYGRNVMIQCPDPEHADRNPSCEVFVGKRDGSLRWLCLSCGAKGDVFDLVRHVRAVTSFAGIMSEAATLLGGTYTPHEGDALPTDAPDDLDTATFAAVASTFITSGLTSLDRRDAADVREYLTSRGVLHLAQRDGWCVLPDGPDRDTLRQYVIDEHGVEAWRGARLHGLRWKYPHLRVVIPWRDRDGRITGIQARGIDATEPRYVSRGERLAPYGAHRASDRETPVAYVEGAFDALALECLMKARGREVHALGLPGVGVWNSGWTEFSCERAAWVALDLDAKTSTTRAVGQRRKKMKADLEGVARVVKNYAPRLDGKPMKDWSDVWEATRW